MHCKLLLPLLALLLAVPVLGVFSSWVNASQGSLEVLGHLFDTVMGEQARTAALLAIGVAAWIRRVRGIERERGLTTFGTQNLISLIRQRAARDRAHSVFIFHQQYARRPC